MISLILETFTHHSKDMVWRSEALLEDFSVLCGLCNREKELFELLSMSFFFLRVSSVTYNTVLIWNKILWACVGVRGVEWQGGTVFWAVQMFFWVMRDLGEWWFWRVVHKQELAWLSSIPLHGLVYWSVPVPALRKYLNNTSCFLG